MDHREAVTVLAARIVTNRATACRERRDESAHPRGSVASQASWCILWSLSPTIHRPSDAPKWRSASPVSSRGPEKFASGPSVAVQRAWK